MVNLFILLTRSLRKRRFSGKTESCGGMSPASGHHTEVKPSTSYDDARGKVLTYEHHVGKKPSNRYQSMYQPLDIMFGRGSFMGITPSIFYSHFQARKK
jgi:hypothetical protein